MCNARTLSGLAESAAAGSCDTGGGVAFARPATSATATGPIGCLVCPTAVATAKCGPDGMQRVPDEHCGARVESLGLGGAYARAAAACVAYPRPTSRGARPATAVYAGSPTEFASVVHVVLEARCHLVLAESADAGGPAPPLQPQRSTSETAPGKTR
eukprot:7922274-Alexandrium_andersonii.AAC.1